MADSSPASEPDPTPSRADEASAGRWASRSESPARGDRERSRRPAEPTGRTPSGTELEQMSRYRALFDAIDQGFCVVEVLFDEEGNPEDYRFLEVNSAFEAHTGLEDPEGRTMRSLRPGQEDHWFETYGEVARTREPQRFEREAAALGRWYAVHAFPVGPPDGNRVGILFRDVTERRERVKALREAKVYAESIVETLHEPLLVLTSDLRVKSANPAFYERFRVDPDETVGRRVYQLGNGQWDIPALRKLLEDVLPDDQVFEDFEVEHDFDDIGRRVMLLNARRLDHVQLILLGIRDITERKREEEELREAKRAAERANRVKSDFMATISHELRTPLNAIVGYTELLLDDVPEPISRPAKEQVERIGHSAGHLRQLIDEILLFSRLEAGREAVEEGDVSISGLVDEIRAVVEPMARDAALSLVLDPHEAPERVRTDPRKLRQILINLLGNAVKFTEEGEVSLRIAPQGDDLLFHVADTGPGIEPEERKDLFEPFWQGGAADDASAGGTGLGLTISARYAEMLGGELSVRSTPGEGSVFTLRLPGGG